MDELKTLQITGTIEQFFIKIDKLCNRINNRQLIEKNSTYTSQEVQRAALNTFTNHIPQPTKSIIIARNPSDVDKAYKIVIEARHQLFTKFGPQHATKQTNYFNHRNFQNNKYNHGFQNKNNNRNFQNNNNNREFESNTRQVHNNYNTNRSSNTRYNKYNNYNTNQSSNSRYNHNHYNNPNTNRNHVNGNYNYNLSSRTRRSTSVEPMEISHAHSNFGLNSTRLLPYVILTQKSKTFYLLIDSGAEFSIINEGIFYHELRRNISTTIKTFGNISEINHMYEVPLFNEFNQQNTNIEFLEHNLHNRFDGLIGNNILEKLKCIIDYPKRQLRTPYSTIPLFLNTEEEEYYEKANDNYCVEISNLYINNDNKIVIDENINKNDEQNFSDIFYSENSDLTFTNEIKHRIQTTHEAPIYSKSYRYPHIHEEEVDKQINDMLKQKIIRPSNSPYNSPIWVVDKKQDNSGIKKWRIVIDYRKLNNITIEDRFPIPNIDDIFDKLGRAQYFTTLDLAKGFHQIELDPADIHKTAFSTAKGHYEFLRMPFGLRNAPATFQRMINNVLKDHIGKICLVYMDDIIVFSTSIEEHILSLKKIFKRLREANLKIQLDKCKFMAKETEFLGHIVTPEGIKTNPNKIKAIQKIILPKNAKEIKSFLGITGYYRKFIKDYSKIAYNMVKYLKKNSKVDLKDKSYIESFIKLKTLLTSDPILSHPDFTKPFVVTTDASNFALGAVLTQNNKPIAYASRTLNDHEKKYSTIEKELLAIVWATKYFRPYLFGRKFTLKTDHKPLVWLNGLKEPNSKLQRWKIKLNEFDFEIEYIRGKENIVADGLSRIKSESIKINTNEICEEEDMQTVHSAETDGTDFIQSTSKALNIFKNQIKIDIAERQSIKTKIFFNKTRKIISITDNSNLLEIMKEILPPKGLVAIFMENDHLFAKFQNIFRTFFARNTKLKVRRSNLLLEDITDNEILMVFMMCRKRRTSNQLLSFATTHIMNDHFKQRRKQRTSLI